MVRVILLALVLIPGVVWAQTRTEPLPPMDSEAGTLLERAEWASSAGDLEKARLVYRLLIETYPQSSLRDQAYFGLALINGQQEDYSGAALLIQKLIDEFPDSPLVSRARHELAVTYINLAQYDKAIPILERERDLSEDPAGKELITNLIIDVHIRRNDRIGAISELVGKPINQEDETDETEPRILQLMEESSIEELKRLVRTFPREYPGDVALLQIAGLYETSHQYFEAGREWRRFLSKFPNHPSARDVRSRIGGLKKRLLKNRYLIGVLLPLSGDLEPFGRQVLKGIRLAVNPDVETVPGRLVLQGAAPENPAGFADIVVRDMGEGETLEEDLENLIREYRVSAIIGPLLSRKLAEVADNVNRHRVPLLAPAAGRDLPKSWNYVRQNSMTLRQQANRLASLAVDFLDLRRFCILYSDDAYGNEMKRIFTEEVIERGGEIIASASYDLGATDFGPQIRHLKEVDLSKYGTLAPPPEDDIQIREYRPGFDAVFLPGDYDQVGLIAAQLAFYDIGQLPLIGTNGWNSPELVRIGGKHIEGSFFVDGFFPGSEDPAVRGFVGRYRNRYHEEASLLAAQAYDSASIILAGLHEMDSSGKALLEFIDGLEGFPGATGRITFSSLGTLERPLYVLQIKDRRFVEVKEDEMDLLKEEIFNRRIEDPFGGETITQVSEKGSGILP